MNKIYNYFAGAVVSVILCPVLGIFAIITSKKTDRLIENNEKDKAMKYSECTRYIVTLSILFGIFTYLWAFSKIVA